MLCFIVKIFKSDTKELDSKLMQRDYFTLKKHKHTSLLNPGFNPGTSGTISIDHATTLTRMISMVNKLAVSSKKNAFLHFTTRHNILYEIF